MPLAFALLLAATLAAPARLKGSRSRVPGLSLTTAAYRLDRTNTRATDPTDPTRIVQTGDSNTNISPASPRTLCIGLTAAF
jgi:hypothetical protein